MSITVQFKDYEEMVAFAQVLLKGNRTEPSEGKEAIKKLEPMNAPDQVTESLPIGEEEAPVEEETKTYTLEEVRAAMAELTRKGKAKDVKTLLISVGAKNLSSVDPKDYATLMEKAGAI